MESNSKKRKQPSDGAPASKRPRFTPKPHHNISTTATKSAYPNGELNVLRFMRAHEDEIKALERAMTVAKKGKFRRAFQDVPRDMRRRTGSHNPQRVPRGLRKRAWKEANEDNTPTKRGKSGSGVGKGTKSWLRKESIKKHKKAKEKRAEAKEQHKITVTTGSGERLEGKRSKLSGTKAGPSVTAKKPMRQKQVALAVRETPPSRFRRRQIHKTWLPTHLFHAKRARMTPPKEPLWHFAIPLSPAVKVYRATHRAAVIRGSIAWDMSYMATIGLEGVEASIRGLLQALHFAGEAGTKPWQEQGMGKKWRDGVRAWEGWICEREGKIPKKIAPVTVIWSVPGNADNNKRKVFVRVHPSAFLCLWGEVLKAAKVQKPTVSVEDLRFEIGSIEIRGPAAAEALSGILQPVNTSSEFAPTGTESVWSEISPVTDVGSLPSNAIMAFSVSDPRLRYPPRAITVPQGTASQTQLIATLVAWPPDRTRTASPIFTRNVRLAAQRSLPAQKSINRRIGAAIVGQYPDVRSTDPEIPCLIYASKASSSWTVLLPWKCVPPIWRCLMHYPVSTGGTPRFGGLQELRQVNFERSQPCFPFDFPGTDAGWNLERQERTAREHEWTKRPKGRRVEWSSIDLGKGRIGEIGDPWACEWERLLPKTCSWDGQSRNTGVASSPFRQLSAQKALDLIAGRLPHTDYFDTPHVFTVKITMVGRGILTACARIYRLPPNDTELRRKWISLVPALGSKRPSKEPRRSNDKHMSTHNHSRKLAAELLQPEQSIANDHPIVPDEEDLIGFVTTGNFNLAEGKPTAVANLVLHRVLDGQHADNKATGVSKQKHTCIIREVGMTVGRLATWEVV